MDNGISELENSIPQTSCLADKLYKTDKPVLSIRLARFFIKHLLMKRIRCPKCDNYITFDETRYTEGQQLVFQCSECGKQFAIRITPKSKTAQEDNNSPETSVGTLHVIANRFHERQLIQLSMGDNSIGKYAKGNNVRCAIESCDPSLDLHHCVITVSRDKNNKLKYVLRDGPSNTGTFVDNEILGDRERRVISDGTLFTLGATRIILVADAHCDDNKPEIA